MGTMARMLNCLFLGCNKKQIPYLLTLLDRGYKVFVFDQDAAAITLKNCEFFPISYSDVDIIVQYLIQRDIEIDLLFSAGDQASQFYLAQIAKRIEKPFLSEKIAERILDKSKFYEDFIEFDINIPSTEYAFNNVEYHELVEKLLNDHDKIYVKSDFSKNPRYIYTADSQKIPVINWKSDRYFQNCYILQPEVVGQNVRINIMGKDVFLFDFF